MPATKTKIRNRNPSLLQVQIIFAQLCEFILILSIKHFEFRKEKHMRGLFYFDQQINNSAKFTFTTLYYISHIFI